MLAGAEAMTGDDSDNPLERDHERADHKPITLYRNRSAGLLNPNSNYGANIW